jgi:hypothetical protein
MATILPFVRRQNVPSARRSAVAGALDKGEADVVIFPGVRYERRSTDDTKTSTKARLSPSRRKKAKGS